MIQTHGLRFGYDAHRTFTFPDFTCPEGETLLLLGNSGQGKTTLLHLMALLLKPTSGSILLVGKATEKFSVSEAAKFRAENIGIVYQRPHFVNALSVMDNLILAPYLAGRTLDKDKAKSLAETLGFSEHLNKKPNQLSLGEQQRVGIARACMNAPKLLLADEPTSSLDDTNCSLVTDLLAQQATELSATLLIVTHDARLKSRFPNQISLG